MSNNENTLLSVLDAFLDRMSTTYGISMESIDHYNRFRELLEQSPLDIKRCYEYISILTQCK